MKPLLGKLVRPALTLAAALLFTGWITGAADIALAIRFLTPWDDTPTPPATSAPTATSTQEKQDPQPNSVTSTHVPPPSSTSTHVPPPSSTSTRVPQPTGTSTPTPSATSTHTPSATATASPSATATIAPSFTPTPTATPLNTLATAINDLEIYTGPGNAYPEVGVLHKGESVKVLGTGGGWWQVACPADVQDYSCWLTSDAQSVQIEYGEGVPTVSTPPPPAISDSSLDITRLLPSGAGTILVVIAMVLGIILVIALLMIFGFVRFRRR